MKKNKIIVFLLLALILLFIAYFNYWRIAYYIDKEYYFHKFPYNEFKDKKISTLMNQLQLSKKEVSTYLDAENFIDNDKITFFSIEVYFKEIKKGSYLTIYFNETITITYNQSSEDEEIEKVKSKILNEYKNYTIEAIGVHKDYYKDKHYTDKLIYQRSP